MIQNMYLKLIKIGQNIGQNIDQNIDIHTHTSKCTSKCETFCQTSELVWWYQVFNKDIKYID